MEDNDNRSKLLEAILEKITPVKNKECANPKNAWDQLDCLLSQADTATISPYNAENIQHSFAETLAAARLNQSPKTIG